MKKKLPKAFKLNMEKVRAHRKEHVKPIGPSRLFKIRPEFLRTRMVK